MNRLLLPMVLIASTAACATILDFQDPTDLPSPAADAAKSAPLDTNTPAPASTHVAGPSSSTSSSSGATTDEPDATTALVKECTCVPSAPSGWSGPFVVAEAHGNDPPSCSVNVDHPMEAYFGREGWSAEPAACSCACGAPAGVACSVPSTFFYANNSCEKGVCRVADGAQTCSVGQICNDGNKVEGVSFGPSLPSGGSCAPSATVNVPPPTWTKSIRLCAGTAASAACDGGVCQLSPSPLFSATNRCVTKSGEADCPPSFPMRQVFHAEGADTRGCSACSCGAPTGTTCAASVVVMSGASCRVDARVDAPSDCLDIAAGSRVETGPGIPSGGSCELTGGGESVGSFAEGRATTVCCLE